MNLLILGAGQHGRVVKEIAEATAAYDKIDFLDDAAGDAVGKLEEYKKLLQKYDSAFPAFGNAKLRQGWMNKLKDAGYKLPAIIHPTAVISPSASIEETVVVGQLAVVNTHSVIGRGTILSAGSKVDHDCRIGICCHIDCGAVVPSNSVIADEIKLEAGKVFDKR